MAVSPEKEREQNSMKEKRQPSPEEEKKRQISSEREEKLQVTSDSEEKRRQSPEKEKKGQLSPGEEEEKRQQSPEKENKGQLSPEEEEKGQLSPEKEKKCQLSPENKERRRVYRERFLNFESRLQNFARKVILCKEELLERESVLKTIVEEKSIDTIKWKETSLCNELKMDFSSLVHDLRKCLECNAIDCGQLEYIRLKDNHQSKEAELMIAEIKKLHAKTLKRHHVINVAEKKEEELSSMYSGQEKKYNQLLVAISEREKRKELTYPTKPESDEDVGAHPSKAKDSRVRSLPDSPESRMLKKGKFVVLD